MFSEDAVLPNESLMERLPKIVDRLSKITFTVLDPRYIYNNKDVLKTFQQCGIGSGFFLGDNIAVTAAHVVQGFSSVLICDHEFNIYPASVVFSINSWDVAILVLQYQEQLPDSIRSNLSNIKLRSSNDIKLGELVVVIGASLGLVGPNVSLGVVSAKGRISPSGICDLLQLSAIVHPGNSGGPVADMEGRIIGMVIEAPELIQIKLEKKDFMVTGFPDKMYEKRYGIGLCYALPADYIDCLSLLLSLKHFGRAFAVEVIEHPLVKYILSQKAGIYHGVLIINVKGQLRQFLIPYSTVIVSIDDEPVTSSAAFYYKILKKFKEYMEGKISEVIMECVNIYYNVDIIPLSLGLSYPNIRIGVKRFKIKIPGSELDCFFV